MTSTTFTGFFSAEDAAAAERLAGHLRAAGWEVHIDDDDEGDLFVEAARSIRFEARLIVAAELERLAAEYGSSTPATRSSCRRASRPSTLSAHAPETLGQEDHQDHDDEEGDDGDVDGTDLHGRLLPVRRSVDSGRGGGLSGVSELAEAFRPVGRAFERLVGRRPGGGALVVRMRGETVVDLAGGSADARGLRPWTPDTLAISFSTTKGVASTVLHTLAERGLLGYDDPVAAHWPEFAAGGKERVTVRDVLTHRAGLHSVRALASRADEILDHLAMEERLAARSVRAPTSRSAYHAMTYGWLVAGLLRRVTGRGMAELVRSELAEPLGVDGLHVGVPAELRTRMAEPVGSALRHLGSAVKVLAPLWTRATHTRAGIEALHVPGFDRLFTGAEPAIWSTEMPAVNGAFSAGALARLYEALASGGAPLLRPETVEAIGRVQVRTADAVLGIPMRWRLGYHQAFTAGRQAPRAFGHYGYGGSGGWADPDLGLSVGFVTNRIGSLSTPLGDLTLLRLNRVVRECAARANGGRPLHPPQ